MNVIKKIFGKNNNHKSKKGDIKTNRIGSEIKVNSFDVVINEVEGFPFEQMLNTKFEDIVDQQGFDWFWQISMKAFECDVKGYPSEGERKKLMNLMTEIIKLILYESDIRLVGTGLYKAKYHIVFYAKNEDRNKIKGAIEDMPLFLEDLEVRFLNYQGVEDKYREKMLSFFRPFT